MLHLMMVDCTEASPSMLTHLTPLLHLSSLGPMTADYNSCAGNCSGHGECYEGICFCEVQYSGGSCMDPNLSYYIGFSAIFYIICCVSFVQLLLCVKSEFTRMKTPSLLLACRITTQKALYVVICLATALRGFYFSSPANSTIQWASSLMSAYYPILLTGSSLIVCFWAEVFHLRDLHLDKPRFLSKSFIGFIIFNVITYSLLVAELVLLQLTDHSDNKSLFSSIFNGCYAILMFVVLVFFLIYGIQVYFKVRGGFIEGSSSPTDTSQLHQSRFGLVSQAMLLLITVAFLFSDVTGSLWKDKVRVLSRNCHNVMFRIVELGVALWFPCVLWNCFRPEQLWILNPQKILKKQGSEKLPQSGETDALVVPSREIIVKTELSSSSERLPECWICYDPDSKDSGPLIQPCLCKGDVSLVHHECLKKWLVESSGNPDNTNCKVCNEKYEIQRNHIWLPNGLTTAHWFQTAAIIAFMCSSVAGACLVVKLFNNVGIRTLAVGLALLAEYVCLRLLGFSFLTAYQRAKFSAVNILGRKYAAGASMGIVTVTHTFPSVITASEYPDATSEVAAMVVKQHGIVLSGSDMFGHQSAGVQPL